MEQPKYLNVHGKSGQQIKNSLTSSLTAADVHIWPFHSQACKSIHMCNGKHGHNTVCNSKSPEFQMSINSRKLNKPH